jgi:hypothetical protein
MSTNGAILPDTSMQLNATPHAAFYVATGTWRNAPASIGFKGVSICLIKMHQSSV